MQQEPRRRVRDLRHRDDIVGSRELLPVVRGELDAVCRLADEAVYTDLQMDLPQSFSLTLLSDGILDLLPGDTLKEKETLLPQLVSSAGGTLDGLRRVFGLAKLGDMPDDIALLVMSRNLA